MDPAFLTNFEWTEIGKTLTLLWVFLLLIILFAANLILAHTFIPSLVSTGHLPERILRLRSPLYVAAILFFGVAMYVLALASDRAHIIEDIWPRWYL